MIMTLLDSCINEEDSIMEKDHEDNFFQFDSIPSIRWKPWSSSVMYHYIVGVSRYSIVVLSAVVFSRLLTCIL